MHGVLVFEEDLHSDERLATLLREHVPRLGAGEQVGHGALRQAEHGFAEQPLADRVLAQLLFHLLEERRICGREHSVTRSRISYCGCATKRLIWASTV